jgi:hypothetical protein
MCAITPEDVDRLVIKYAHLQKDANATGLVGYAEHLGTSLILLCVALQKQQTIEDRQLIHLVESIGSGIYVLGWIAFVTGIEYSSIHGVGQGALELLTEIPETRAYISLAAGNLEHAITYVRALWLSVGMPVSGWCEIEKLLTQGISEYGENCFLQGCNYCRGTSLRQISSYTFVACQSNN